MTKPNLFIIGASKCGTTSLWYMLGQHPEIYMSKLKETSFFSFSDYEDRQKWYEDLFVDAKNQKYIGEASPIYSETTLITETPKRIYNYSPNAKIIYIVREPISRLKSVWRQTLATGHWYKHQYQKFGNLNIDLMPKNFINAVYEYPSFIEATKYWTQINNYRKYFSDENILILFFEDLKNNPKLVLNQIYAFLQINPFYHDELFKQMNSSIGKKKDYLWIAKLKSNKTIYKYYRYIFSKWNINIPRKAISYEINISPEQKERILNILEKETSEILKYANKDVDFWKKDV